ncbi:pentatricopeptide repeat-containing protein At4g13650-like [Wolffia australiana]
MYSRLKLPFMALQVFDEMPLRNPASWNAAVSCCARAGLFSESRFLLREMLLLGIPPSGFVFAGVLSCAMARDGAQIHGFVSKTGQIGDVFVGTSLLHCYGCWGLISEMEKLFPEISCKNVVSWTAFMSCLARNGQLRKSMAVFCRMRKSMAGNENSFATVISACAELEDARLGMEILAQIVVSGFESSVSVCNSLINLFHRIGRPEISQFIFRRMNVRDRISWNSMLSVFSRDGFSSEAVHLFKNMVSTNISPDSTSFCSLISSCYSAELLKLGESLHSVVLKLGLTALVTVSNSLVTMYSLCGGHCDAAEQVFDEMPNRDLISWNSLIAAYLSSGEEHEALKLLSQMTFHDIKPNPVTLATSMAACSSSSSSSSDYFKLGRAVHGMAVQTKLEDDLLVGNSLITMYGKLGAMEEAQRAFRSIRNPDLVSWNALISVFAEKEQSKEAVDLFNTMRVACCRPNQITIAKVLGACISPQDLSSFGTALHGLVVVSGFDAVVNVKNSVLSAYSKGGDLNACNAVFDEIDIKSLVTWNVMIFAGACNGESEEALKMFVELRRGGMEADEFTYSAAMAACSSLAILQEGEQLHGQMTKLGFLSKTHVLNGVLDMYSKCGKMSEAEKLFSTMERKKKLLQTWNIILSGYARHGRCTEAKSTFENMIAAGESPDRVTFVSLLSAYNHAGLVDEGLALFSSMEGEFRVLPEIEHCVCIVDLLGRAGRIEEAEKFVEEEMPVQANDLIWRSLLSSCRIHGQVALGKKAAERLLEADPEDDSAYVLLSNVYAGGRRWADVEKLRRKMEQTGTRKKPGWSWIRVKNSVSVFGTGEEGLMFHPQATEIRGKMEEMMREVRRVGYVAETQFAFHDMEEEEREQSLWGHSEKTALALGLVAAPLGATITVYKNLRVCGDCHLVYKLVSATMCREIVLRDCYRFHHFTGGVCSCSDYW